MSKPTPEEFVRRTMDGVYALALRLTGNPTDAWDLAQDALLRALKALPSFRGDADPRTWVYRITVNAFKNARTTGAARFRSSTLSLDAPPEEGRRALDPAGDPPADAALERRAQGEAIERALASLSPEDRAALSLREFDDLSYGQIAEVLDVPIGTVKSRIHRARTELAKALETLR